jgi:hypothetical protein
VAFSVFIIFIITGYPVRLGCFDIPLNQGFKKAAGKNACGFFCGFRND